MIVRGSSIVQEYVMEIRCMMNVVYAVAMVQVVVEPILLILREVVGTLPTPAAAIQTKMEILQL